MLVDFEALEYQANGQFRPARYRFAGTPQAGWQVWRQGQPHLTLGPGYRLLKTVACGVCSTDLDRHFLPFALPQITGHELVALDEHGQRYVVEINASHAARAVAHDCPFCRAGLPTHCPERLVLGIDTLAGGFGPYVLAPVEAALPLPEAIPTDTAVLIEPLAAALHAVQRLAPRSGQTVAVLGPRRLGLLVIAALASYARHQDLNLDILALSRHEALLARARECGATRGLRVQGAGDALPDGLAEIVIDTTGHPSGLELALRLARREVHLKTTCGQPSAGLTHLTELVVDELGLAPLSADLVPRAQDLAQSTVAGIDAGRPPLVAWLSQQPPPTPATSQSGPVRLLHAESPREALARLESGDLGHPLRRADAAVVDSPAAVDAVIRPDAARQIALVRPRGQILIHPAANPGDSTLLQAVARRGLRLSSSRCGDFRPVLALMQQDPRLLTLGQKLITHRLGAACLAEAFAMARASQSIKVLVEHGAGAPSNQAGFSPPSPRKT